MIRLLKKRGAKYVKQLIEERVKFEKFHTSSDWVALRNHFVSKKLKEESILKCTYCKSIIPKGDITVDHIKPRSKYPEQALDINNLTIACRSCNSSKGAKEDWI